jgi:serine protease Do
MSRSSRFNQSSSCIFGLALAVISVWCGGNAWGQLSFVHTTRAIQPKIVKIYGAGGMRGMEPYQSGFVASAEGHIVTAFSYVLDTDSITATLDDGSRFEATLLGTDPRLEIAVLKIDANGLEHFALDQSTELKVGQRILAFSNLYGIASGNEPASVQHGQVSSIWKLSARKGTFRTPYNGRVYVLDAMTNNAGAAGGVLTDLDGNLAGILGKELRSSDSNTWLNYALPISEIETAVADIISGKTRVTSANDTDNAASESPWTTALLGIRLVPNLMPKTPPFVEEVIPTSPAAAAGLLPDDLVVYVDQRVVRSQKQLFEILTQLDREEPLSLVVLRDQELHPITLRPRE